MRGVAKPRERERRERARLSHGRTGSMTHADTSKGSNKISVIAGCRATGGVPTTPYLPPTVSVCCTPGVSAPGRQACHVVQRPPAGVGGLRITHYTLVFLDLSNRWGIFHFSTKLLSHQRRLIADRRRKEATRAPAALLLRALLLVYCPVLAAWKGSLFFVACLSFSLRVLASFWRADTKHAPCCTMGTQLFFRRSECLYQTTAARRAREVPGGLALCSLPPPIPTISRRQANHSLTVHEIGRGIWLARCWPGHLHQNQGELRSGSRRRGREDPLAKDSGRLLYTCLTWRIDVRKTTWDENALLIEGLLGRG